MWTIGAFIVGIIIGVLGEKLIKRLVKTGAEELEKRVSDLENKYGDKKP